MLSELTPTIVISILGPIIVGLAGTLIAMYARQHRLNSDVERLDEETDVLDSEQSEILAELRGLESSMGGVTRRLETVADDIRYVRGRVDNMGDSDESE